MLHKFTMLSMWQKMSPYDLSPWRVLYRPCGNHESLGLGFRARVRECSRRCYINLLSRLCEKHESLGLVSVAGTMDP